jgi:threonine dehydrogenase-like Zn-dependent dehydrogenase
MARTRLMNNRSRRMRAARIVASQKVELESVPIPDLGPSEARFRVEGTGVCASNLGPWLGLPWTQYPLKPGESGHEAWGVVEDVGRDVRGLEPGDRVAAISYNAYAEYDVAPADCLLRLPPALDGKAFPGEPLACAVNIFERSCISHGQLVAIIGIGFLGALLTRLATNAGARVIAISRRPFSLSLARELGAAETIAMEDHGAIIERVSQLSAGRFCDRVIEATGKQWPLDLGAELTRTRGTLVIAGYHQDGPRQVNMQLWNWRGLDVINAHERESSTYLAGMQAAARAVSAGTIDPEPLYTHRYPLERLGEALEATRERPVGFIKALVQP